MPAHVLELQLTMPDGSRQRWTLRAGDNFIGRWEECDIALRDPEKWLGRRHAVVQIAPTGITLTDLQSVNGTYVDGNVIQSIGLVPGMKFRLGPYFEFELIQR